MENWKPVPGYEGLYEVSDHGRIRGVDRLVPGNIRTGWQPRKHTGRVLRQKTRSNGYKSVSLCKNGAITDTLVHRVVAAAFCEQLRPEDTQVNHKNLHKDDNRAVNLEWCTPSANVTHAIHTGAYDRVIGYENRKPILCVETGHVFPSSYQAAEWVNSTKYGSTKNTATMSRTIRSCATGKTRVSYGFHWKDVEQQPSTTIPKGSTPKRVEMGDSA